jgi:exodeoxyribonuclease VII large subunit
MLDAAVRRSAERLRAVRLVPALVQRRIEEGRRTLDNVWRIAAQAHPDKPLAKGYARVEDQEGHTLISAEAARAAVRLRLVFGDGRVDAAVAGVERARRGPYAAKAEQPKLL